MEIYFDLFLPKNLPLSSYSINESLVEWGGETFSRDPLTYTWGDNILFERNDSWLFYQDVLGDNVDFKNYYLYTLKGGALYDLESAVNNRFDLFSNSLIQFITLVLNEIDDWVIVLSIIDQDVDVDVNSLHKIEAISDACSLIAACLNRDNPQSIVLTRRRL